MIGEGDCDFDSDYQSGTRPQKCFERPTYLPGYLPDDNLPLLLMTSTSTAGCFVWYSTPYDVKLPITAMIHQFLRVSSNTCIPEYDSACTRNKYDIHRIQIKIQ